MSSEPPPDWFFGARELPGFASFHSVGYSNSMFRSGILILFAATLLCMDAAKAENIVFSEHFDGGLGAQWKKVEFTGETQHTIHVEGTNSVLEARANSSASGLAVRLNNLAPERLILRWRWRIDRTPPNGSDTEIKRFDHTARLFVAFKTLLGPPRTINYVWANEIPVGKTFEHPNSSRSRFIVMESGNARAGQWIQEERRIGADWKQLFGGDKAPAVVALGFMTDSDGTKSTVTGWYDDFELLEAPAAK